MRRDEALDALEQAKAMDAKVRPGGSWYMAFGTVFGVGSAVVVLVVGLFPGSTLMTVVMVLFFVMLAALLAWALTRPVSPRRFGWIHGLTMAAWSAIYLTAILAGQLYFHEEPRWWIPAALACALPPLIGGYIALRRSRSVT